MVKEIFTTPEGETVIGQEPNFPVMAAAVLGTAALFLHGEPKRIAAKGAGLAFLVWGAMELGSGVNAFRRTLGAGAILITAATVVRHHRRKG